MSRILNLSARTILDSRGDWTVTAELTLADGRTVSAAVPRGKSMGSHEAKAVEAEEAVANIQKFIAPKLAGQDPAEQGVIDNTLVLIDGTDDKHGLGANAMLAVSMACARAAALAANIPLWQHLRSLLNLPVASLQDGVMYPRLYINVINGGQHAGNNLEFQEYLVIPRTSTFIESATIGTALYHALGKKLTELKGDGAVGVGDEGGYAPDFSDNLEPFRIIMDVARELGFEDKINIGLDAAASDIKKTAGELTDIYQTIAREFPAIYIEDPFGEEAFMDFASLHGAIPNMLIAGDDLTTTNVHRMEEAHDKQSINSVIIKPNQIGTISETLDAIRLARKFGWGVVVSHRSGETDDDFIADLAYGVGADGFKLGAPARGERIAKYNRLLEIEKG